MTHFAYRLGFANVRALLVVSLIVSLMSTVFVNTALGIHAFAKRKSSDRVSKDASDSREENGADLGDNSFRGREQQSGADSLPLPVETSSNSKFVIINFDDSYETIHMLNLS